MTYKPTDFWGCHPYPPPPSFHKKNSLPRPSPSMLPLRSAWALCGGLLPVGCVPSILAAGPDPVFLFSGFWIWIENRGGIGRVTSDNNIYVIITLLTVRVHCVTFTYQPQGGNAMKITPEAHRDIIEAYTIDLWPIQEIANVLHVSKTTVHRFLNAQGIDTSKRRITVSCTTCGRPIERTRAKVRKQRNHFCGLDCYHFFLDVGRTPSMPTRAGQRIAREVVSKYFDLQPEHVVHHKDRNAFNNNPSNLMVFRNNGDHIKYHHANRDKYANQLTQKTEHREAWERYNHTTIEPLWDGGADDGRRIRKVRD